MAEAFKQKSRIIEGSPSTPVAITLRSLPEKSTLYPKQRSHQTHQMRIDKAEFKMGNTTLKNKLRNPLAWNWVVATKGSRIGGFCEKDLRAPGYKILNRNAMSEEQAKHHDPLWWQDFRIKKRSDANTSFVLNVWHMGTACTNPSGESGDVTGEIAIAIEDLENDESRLPEGVNPPGKYTLHINVTLSPTL